MRGVSFICIGEKAVTTLRRLVPPATRGLLETDSLLIRIVCDNAQPNECALPIVELIYKIAEKLDKPVIPL